jgi:Xaa-Pro aminopeptidase
MPSPVIEMMAEKNEAEIESSRSAHIRDAIMFCNFTASIGFAVGLFFLSCNHDACGVFCGVL